MCATGGANARVAGATHELTERLLDLVDLPSQRRFLEAHPGIWRDDVAEAMKATADRFLRSDLQRSLDVSQALLYLSGLSGSSSHRALGLLACANVELIGNGEYQQAIDLFDEAAGIYSDLGDPVRQARSQTGKIAALSRLGRHDEALQTGERASQVMREHGNWKMLADLKLNLAAARQRTWDDQGSLGFLEEARDLYAQIGSKGEPYLPWVEGNRAIALCRLGRFEESVAASKAAIEMLDSLDQSLEAVRARQNLAVTYIVTGRYNEGLAILDETAEAFLADSRHRDALLAELLSIDCLLSLRRFSDVILKCARIRESFGRMGARFEVAQALLYKAVAFAGVGQLESMASSFSEARAIFAQEGNETWLALVDLEQSALELRAEEYERSFARANRCLGFLENEDRPVHAARCRLICAEAALGLGNASESRHLAEAALEAATAKDVPMLIYLSRRVLGRLHEADRDTDAALGHYELAAIELERLRGRIMVEYRADFLQDKQSVYEDAVTVCLDSGSVMRALEFAERSKSRALVDLLSHQIDLSIRPRSAGDAPLIDELIRLRQERDQLIRRWQTRSDLRDDGWELDEMGRRHTRQRVVALERQITDRWHRVLVRNADYARDAALWRVQPEPVQQNLPPGAVLLEYFCARGELVVFVVTASSVRHYDLSCGLGEIEKLVRMYWLNLQSVPGASAEQAAGLSAQSLGVLERLHQALLHPVMESLDTPKELIIVPHGVLHYLPFHALYDGSRHLVERHAVSYLPSASLLSHRARPVPEDGHVAVFGHSSGGKLPHAEREAQAVAASFGQEATVGHEANRANLVERARGARIVHVATHGEFRRDSPMFSGLYLDDGWLTALDVFSMQLSASLVTLSACETGRHVVGGGDELLGLMRAFLYAGAASLVLSLWTADDQYTRALMERLYSELAAGCRKGEALRRAQLSLLRPPPGADTAGGERPHPYYWAPFFLVGATDAL